MPTERISFTGHAGHDLAARLDLPEGPVLATALFAHCFTCSKDIPAARRIAARLSAMGIAVLRFDFTGLGHSGGEFANTSFTSNVADLIAAARGIVDLVDSNMTGALKVMSVERGLDPRDFALSAFGGAGPVHGADLMRSLGATPVDEPV